LGNAATACRSDFAARRLQSPLWREYFGRWAFAAATNLF